MIKIADKKPRSVLMEGRNHQMGFAFLKNTKKNAYETVQPISPCKDYLNDIVYSEAMDKPVCAYGLSYSKLGIFDGKKSYMVISICGYNGSGKYPQQDQDIKNLEENYENLEKFMQFFDKEMGMNFMTKITRIQENQFLVEFDYKWCRGTYLISLYSLLLRIGQFWNGKKDPMAYVDKFTEFQDDVYLVNNAKAKLKKLIKEGIVEQDMSGFRGGTDVHNCGIIGYHLNYK